MDRWLATLPKKMIAFGSIAIGIFLIILFNPPHSLCDSQKELFIQEQTGFVFLDPSKPKVKTTVSRRLIDACKLSNSPGGCYEYFGSLRNLVKKLRRIGSDCSGSIANMAQVKSLVWESVELMVQLAWGSAPPESIAVKQAWLDAADINLFCELKSFATDFYGESAWESFREKTMNELPQAQTLTRPILWERSLLSTNCMQFQ